MKKTIVLLIALLALPLSVNAGEDYKQICGSITDRTATIMVMRQANYDMGQLMDEMYVGTGGDAYNGAIIDAYKNYPYHVRFDEQKAEVIKFSAKYARACMQALK